MNVAPSDMVLESFPISQITPCRAHLESRPPYLRRVLGWGRGEGAAEGGVILSWLLMALRITAEVFIWLLRVCKNYHLPSYHTHVIWLLIAFLRSSDSHSGSRLRAFAHAMLTRTILQPLPWPPWPPNSSFRTLLKHPTLDFPNLMSFAS